MGLINVLRGFKTPEFPAGTVFYNEADGDYFLYRIIRFDEAGLLVAAYWPNSVLPNKDNWHSFGLRNACEAFHVAGLEHAVVVAYTPVTDEDDKAFADYQRIEEGVRRRANRMEELQQEAAELVKQERYAEAEALYTEATSFSKYDFRTFAGRGWCYLQLGRLSEAIADLEHALSIDPEAEETREHYLKVKELLGRQ